MGGFDSSCRGYRMGSCQILENMKKTGMLVIIDSLLLVVVLAIILVKPLRGNVISLFSINKKEDVQKMREVQDEILGHRLYSDGTIKQVQWALKRAGFYQGKIDGRFSRNTKIAVRAFQKSKGLNPDGIVETKTQEELNKYLKN